MTVPTRRPFLSRREVLLLAALAFIIGMGTALAFAVRFQFVEPDTVAQACLANAGGWRCAIREVAVYGFLNNVFGWVALISGVLATVARWRWLATVAILVGIVGAVLYRFELSGVGILLGLLVWVKRTPMSNEDGRAEQAA